MFIAKYFLYKRNQSDRIFNFQTPMARCAAKAAAVSHWNSSHTNLHLLTESEHNDFARKITKVCTRIFSKHDFFHEFIKLLGIV